VTLDSFGVLRTIVRSSRCKFHRAELLSPSPSQLLLVLQVLPDRVFPARGIIAVHRGTAPSDILNNAMSERRQTLQFALPAMKRADVYLAVHRYDNSVYYRRIDCEAFLLLKSSQSSTA
jgi:hypothetical protein